MKTASLIFRVKAAIRAFKMPYSADADFRVAPIANPNYSVGLIMLDVDQWEYFGRGSKVSVGGTEGEQTVERIILEVS